MHKTGDKKQPPLGQVHCRSLRVIVPSPRELLFFQVAPTRVHERGNVHGVVACACLLFIHRFVVQGLLEGTVYGIGHLGLSYGFPIYSVAICCLEKPSFPTSPFTLHPSPFRRCCLSPSFCLCWSARWRRIHPGNWTALST